MIHTLLLILPFCLLTESNEAEDGIDELLGSVDLSEWDAWFREEVPESSFCPSAFVNELAGMEDSPDTNGILDRAIRFMQPSIRAAAGKLVFLIGLAVLAAVLNGIDARGSVSETAGSAFRIITACIVLTASVSEIRAVYRMFGMIADLSESVLPVLIGFLTICGMEHTAGILLPSYALLSGVMIRLMETAVIPIGCIGGVMTALDACTTGRLAALGKLLLRAAKWMLAAIASVYGILGAFRGAAAASADGLLLRTAKLAAGSIPAVGSIVSGSVETAYQCLIFVKNALGLGCCALILLACAKPIVNAFFVRCSFRAASAVSEPLSGRPYADLLRGMGDMLHILVLCELAAGAMALSAIAPVIGVGRFS